MNRLEDFLIPIRTGLEPSRERRGVLSKERVAQLSGQLGELRRARQVAELEARTYLVGEVR